jgi:MFS family permease
LVYGPIGPIYNSVMQSRTPESMRGRVVGVMTSMTYSAGPVGFMLAGPLIDRFGLRTTFLALALPILLIGLTAPWIPALRELDDGGGLDQAPAAGS